MPNQAKHDIICEMLPMCFKSFNLVNHVERVQYGDQMVLFKLKVSARDIRVQVARLPNLDALSCFPRLHFLSYLLATPIIFVIEKMQCLKATILASMRVTPNS